MERNEDDDWEGPGRESGNRREGEGRLGYAADEFEQELLEARALIERTVAKHRDRQVRNSLVAEVRPEDGGVAAAARQLLGQAVHSIDILLAGDPELARAVTLSVSERLAGDSRQISVRLLFTRATFDWKLAERFSGDDGRLRVRVAKMPPLTVVIVDGETALVCAESAVGVRASLIRSAPVIRSLCTLADSVWQSATVASERIDFGDRARSDTVRQVLKCLRLGLTDEVAARELAVSVRTYRRYVAEIMSLLGVASRFQAGAHAAKRGLLRPLGSEERDRPETRSVTGNGYGYGFEEGGTGAGSAAS
ncbi:helix-turn-helix transcriptional regulator [Streptomyces sp. H39-S7]|uniref:helix-turn-helix transcriptional regulator n=1 Tax=Streptomyces sp. H39-S7 TaxID=3004357 RepID=UPI0022AECD5F|nr:helix-turn-helix transcriptional regulator [Streptomyces sp. H39-S7]MCZ4125416.1 helix-turn-helix transcriptional regulator [Streptomyces sp. H39-S7]